MKRKSFTLIELLLSTGIIGILAAIVIVAINPGRQLAQARNAQRRGAVNVILNAINQFSLDSSGNLPTGIDTTLRMIGTASGGCAVSCAAAGTTPPPPPSPPPPTPTTVTLAPSGDTSLWQASPTTNYGSNGQLWVYPWTPSWTRRFVIHFDLSSIPANATIESATIRLREATTFGLTRTIGAYRLTEDWEEATASWNNRGTSLPWTTPGGTNVGTPTATALLTWDGILGWNTWDVTTDVRDFYSGVQQNFGWLFRDISEDSSQNYWFFHSSESATSSFRPFMNITYTGGVAHNPPRLIEKAYAQSGTGSTAAACLNLTSALVPLYIPQIPTDPSVGSTERTHYAVRESATGRLLVRACGAELGETIDVER